MNDDLLSCIRLSVTDDLMTAYLYISSTPLEDGTVPAESLTESMLREYMTDHGVKAGIDKELLKSIIINKLFDRNHVIAQGQPPLNGENGQFNFLFKTEVDNHPKVMEDGSVDYRNIDIYEPVTEGEVFATYTPSTPGHYGYTVGGAILPCTPGKELSPLKGNGFEMSEDKLTYTSTLNGKIEYKNDTINITNVLELNSDVDITTGDINFNGDVIIHGNVHMGSVIRSKGSITVMGNVEGAMLVAENEIQLKSGMQGGGRGYLEAGGDIWGKFFEQSIIRCGGNLNVNSMMNCEVYCGKNITISGRHGIIVGGSTVAQGDINATVIGNMAEVSTSISAGVNENTLAEIRELEDDINTVKVASDKHEHILEMLNNIKNPVEVEKLETMRKQVEESLSELKVKYDTLNIELKNKLFLTQSYSRSRITVNKYLYPNVKVTLNGLHMTTKTTFTNVYLVESGGQISIINDITNK